MVDIKSTKLMSLNILNRIYEGAVSPPGEQNRVHKMLILLKQNFSTVFHEGVSDLSQAHAGISNEVRVIEPCDHQR